MATQVSPPEASRVAPAASRRPQGWVFLFVVTLFLWPIDAMVTWVFPIVFMGSNTKGAWAALLIHVAIGDCGAYAGYRMLTTRRRAAVRLSRWALLVNLLFSGTVGILNAMDSRPLQQFIGSYGNDVWEHLDMQTALTAIYCVFWLIFSAGSGKMRQRYVE